MKAKNKTNTDVIQLNIIASKKEWESLLYALDEPFECNKDMVDNYEEIMDSWAKILRPVLMMETPEAKEDTRDIQQKMTTLLLK